VLAQNTFNVGTMGAGEGGSISSEMSGARAGNGGDAHIWGKYRGGGGTLVNTGTSYAGNGGDVQTASQWSGQGGRLKLISLPNVFLECGTHYAGEGGCAPDGETCNRGGDVVIEPVQFCLANTTLRGWNVRIFGGVGATINLDSPASPIIEAVDRAIIAVGPGGAITGQVPSAMDKIRFIKDTILYDVSLMGARNVVGTVNVPIDTQITVLNGGPVADIYNVSIKDLRGWQFAGLPDTVTVDGIATLDLNLTIIAKDWEENEITITLQSQNDPEQVETLVIKTNIGPNISWLPFVARP
jgi:hypothetical protein